jgi:group I intron endonuclease
MPKTYKIYKCVNNVNNKIYVGFTHKKIEKRIIEHKSAVRNGSDYLLHKAIKKYGFENFSWEIIFESFDKKYALDELEGHFIKEFNSFYLNGFGYNMTYGGQGGMLGKTHSIQTREKMKLARKNSKFKIRNPDGIGLEKAIAKSAEVLRGKPSWNKGKKQTWENGGKKFKGKSWKIDMFTGKRIWVEKIENGSH